MKKLALTIVASLCGLGLLSACLWSQKSLNSDMHHRHWEKFRNLGEDALAHGDLDASSNYYQLARQESRSISGDDRQRLLSEAELANVLLQQGKDQEALAAYDHALGLYHGSNGSLRDDRLKEVIASCHAGIAQAYLRLGRPAQAEVMFQAALTELRQMVGPEPGCSLRADDLLQTMLGLADILKSSNRKKEALALYEEAVELCDRTPYLCTAADQIELWQQELSPQARSVQADLSPQLKQARALKELAAKQFAEGDLVAAQQSNQKALDIFEVHDRDAADQTISQMCSIYLQDKQKTNPALIALLSKQLALRTAMYGKSDARVAYTLCDLGNAYRVRDMNEDAEKALARAIAILQLERQHGDLWAHTWLATALVYEKTRTAKEAADAFERFLEVAGSERNLASERDAQRCLDRVCNRYKTEGKATEAAQLRARFDSLAGAPN